MFVRTKKVGDRTYKQLVENYREDGRHRQRVVAHLGHYDTPEEALEGLRGELAEHRSEDGEHRKRLERAIEQERWRRRKLEVYWKEGLDRFHGGEVPRYREVARRMGELHEAPDTDEVQAEVLGIVIYKRQEVERDWQEREYCEGFLWMKEEEQENRDRRPDRYGHTTHFPGNDYFKDAVRIYWHYADFAARRQAEYDRRERWLEERIAKLESVVTK
jgi:hypothetical protein